MHPFTPQDIANSGLSGAAGVDQSTYPDCVFEASVAAVARTSTGQNLISQMIVQNSDGSYAVTFPGLPGWPINVTAADLTQPGVSDSATWAKILQAALVDSNPAFANGSNPPPNLTMGSADGSVVTPAQFALYLLTGLPATKDVATAGSIANEISGALANGQPVVAYCSNNDNNALVDGHEWTVISCDAKTNQITLRNPWGNFGTAGTTKDGVYYDGKAEVSMPISAFGKYYTEVTFGYAPLGLTDQVTLNEMSSFSPAMTSHNGMLFLAWSGIGNNNLNVACSADNGATFIGKARSSVSSTQQPAICFLRTNLPVLQEALFLAWADANNKINICQVNLSGTSITGYGNPVTLADTSTGPPALASINGLLYLGWLISPPITSIYRYRPTTGIPSPTPMYLRKPQPWLRHWQCRTTTCTSPG